MINEEANKSWAIRTYTDELLNFIIFTGCMYNLIDDENFDESNTPWPTKLSNSDFENLHINKLKSQWKLWFNDVIEERCNNINLDKMCVFVNEIYNINDFLELEYTELRECCKNHIHILLIGGICKQEVKALFLFMKLWVVVNFVIISRN